MWGLQINYSSCVPTIVLSLYQLLGYKLVKYMMLNHNKKRHDWQVISKLVIPFCHKWAACTYQVCALTHPISNIVKHVYNPTNPQGMVLRFLFMTLPVLTHIFWKRIRGTQPIPSGYISVPNKFKNTTLKKNRLLKPMPQTIKL